MKKVCFITFLLALLLSAKGIADTKTTFMPENNLGEQDGLFDNGMTEEMFNNIIASVEEYYAPIISNFGGQLVIERNWKDSTVNAYASQDGNVWTVAMFGGLSRRPEVTFDGFAMVVCHEVGHHISGFPFVSSWASNEGASDYFAMQACAKTIWQNTVEENSKADKALDPYAKKLCDQYKGKNNSLCYREMNAGYSLANLLAALGGEKVNFQTPDKTIVKRTSNTHPKAQCRLDTYVAGTLCDTIWDNGVMPQNEKESAEYLCTNHNTEGGYDIQARPRCWFKPTL